MHAPFALERGPTLPTASRQRLRQVQAVPPIAHLRSRRYTSPSPKPSPSPLHHCVTRRPNRRSRKRRHHERRIAHEITEVRPLTLPEGITAAPDIASIEKPVTRRRSAPFLLC